ncbi:hypothetical protein AWB76_04893 [Caballeronia temeraria]|uniref:DRBM domain-containing protein n=1 Tax=Caballeronia temeraria TaxID=1777137 RepID=A0A158BZE6_9BURK|nr:hypothetical protein AWB76_04893 [Caballeronia temeraria]
MSQLFEIALERQPGGWVWAALLHTEGSTLVVGQSARGFPTEAAARHDAARALPVHYIKSLVHP